MFHLHVILWLRSLHSFYSLLKFLKTCEHLSIGNLFYLSNWRMRYSRMTWHLLILAKYLGFILQIKIQIACSLNDIQIPTKAIYDLTWQKPAIYASYFVLSLVKFCAPCWEMLYASKTKTHIHATNNQLFLHRKYAKTCFPSLAK